MSVLDTPRIYFSGNCTWDPMVTNNSANYWDLATSKPDPPLNDADAYRRAVDDEIASHGNWNPQGTHRSVFYETRVRAFDAGSGQDTADPFVGVPLEFRSMLVDLNPYAANTSQLFFDELRLGIDGGPQIRMPSNGPAVGRYLNFGRNASLEIAGRASVIWQASCVDGLEIRPHDSPLLQSIEAAIASGEATGLTVRFNAYRTLYFGGPPPMSAAQDRRYDDLEARVKGGGFQPNPARSLVVGAVGLYRDGEPASTPGDRRLSGALGTAFAKVDRPRGRLVVDLANSVPETDLDANKANLGDLEVAAGDVTLGSLPFSNYDRSAYDATAGIVELELDDAQLDAAEAGDLVISNAGSQPLLTEQALTAVVEPANLYLEGTDDAEVTVRVLRHGKPVGAGVDVQVGEAQRAPATGPGRQVTTVATGPDGTVPVDFSSRPGAALRLFDGSAQWVFTPFEGQQPSPPVRVDTGRDCYLTTRVTPADDDIAALDPTWQNVHQRVLIDWEALAPCMDNWLRLGDEEACRAIAPLIKQLTSLEHFDRYTYMPVTRGLSKGQRSLLHAWCDNPVDAPSRPFGLDAEPSIPVDLSAADVDLSRGFAQLDEA